MKLVGYLVDKDGSPMVFIRPKDAELAMSLATELMGKPYEQVNEQWQEIIRRQTYTYLGFVAQVEKYNYRGKKTVEVWIADEKGKLVCRPKQGDSIITDHTIAVPDWLSKLAIEHRGAEGVNCN